jgi:hypothetical protein
VIVPAAFIVNVVSAVPSPQLTSTEYGPFPLVSVKLPRLNDLDVPATAVWSAGGVTVGTGYTSTPTSPVPDVPPAPVTVTTTFLYE